MSVFDRWLMLDWSAAARPVRGANSIWIAEAIGAADITLHNPATRSEAAEAMEGLLDKRPDDAMLVGIDVSFGLPAGSAAVLRGTTPGAGPQMAPWRELWSVIDAAVTDRADNHNNRFEAAAELNRDAGSDPGPFWGHPPSQRHETLQPTRPPFPWGPAGVAEYRLAELALRRAGHPVQSTWKIAYQASVGGQFLTSIGWLLRLRERYPSRVRIWPFDTGFGTQPEPAEVWIAEVWPGEFPLDLTQPVRDAGQVAGTVRAIREADRSGELTTWLAGPHNTAARMIAASEEGWPLSPALTRARATGD